MARYAAHEAPRILNDGIPMRWLSSFTRTLATPRRAATPGAARMGVGENPGSEAWKARAASSAGGTRARSTYGFLTRRDAPMVLMVGGDLGAPAGVGP